MRQDLIHNAFRSFKINRKSMMEQFILQVKEKSNIKISESEANSLFDTLNRNLQ